MRILYCISHYGTTNTDYIFEIIHCLRRDYDDYAFYIDIHIFATDLVNIFKETSDYKITIHKVNKDLKDNLTWCHRQLMIDKQNDYDLFIYSEDDINISCKSIQAFVNESANLPDGFVAGFLHYEEKDNEKYLMAYNSKYPCWGEALMINGNKYATCLNQHQSSFILTRNHLKQSIASGNFNTIPRCHDHEGQHYHFKETAASEPYTVCNLKKVIPINKIGYFLLHHMPNIYIENKVDPLFNAPFYTLTDFKKKYG